MDLNVKILSGFIVHCCYFGAFTEMSCTHNTVVCYACLYMRYFSGQNTKRCIRKVQ